MAEQAYDDIDVKGYFKIPEIDDGLLKNITPREEIYDFNVANM